MAESSDDQHKSAGMFLSQKPRDMNVRKSIKVKLPIRQHIRLHALKLFGENNISETVERAVDMYFEHMQAEGVSFDEIPTPETLFKPESEGAE